MNIKGKEYKTYPEVLDKAHKDGLKLIRTDMIQIPTSDNKGVCIVKAKIKTDKGIFEAIGDASPSNVNNMIIPHLIRMAETRAKGRALRDAINVGECLKEEM